VPGDFPAFSEVTAYPDPGLPEIYPALLHSHTGSDFYGVFRTHARLNIKLDKMF
jgi:hypothetical protein